MTSKHFTMSAHIVIAGDAKMSIQDLQEWLEGLSRSESLKTMHHPKVKLVVVLFSER